MGKKRKDRAYISATEWREEGGGHRGRLQAAAAAPSGLPLRCCALTFQPWEDPVAAPDGAVFDILAAVPYVRKHGRHPVTGEPLALADLTRVRWRRGAGFRFWALI
jgi:peptidyl-prolyl cis-trans isomerase-like protein 2